MHTFLHFAENPDNLLELVDMGLAVKNERIAQALQDQDGKETPRASLSSGKSDESDAAETVAT